MIERLLIVIVSMIAIIFVPYWVGRLIIPKSKYSNYEGVTASWFLGALILTIFLTLLYFIISVVIPWIIHGKM